MRVRELSVTRWSVVIAALALISAARASALLTQSQGQLVPLVTDQVPLGLSNRFGVPFSATLNQAGDYLFVGAGGTALFVRRAATGTTTRVWQLGDPAPGFPGSKSDIISTGLINSAGLIAFRVDLGLPTGELQGTVMTWDGTTYRVIANGAQPAPGGGGLRYERALALVGLNDSGDILMTATLFNPLAAVILTQPTIFLVPAGQPPQRLVGFGDVAPGTGGGTFSNITSVSFNAAREALFLGSIQNGSTTSGWFVATTSGVRKVAAVGDPAPVIGTFAGPTGARLNNAGEVVFVDSSAVFRNSQATGTTVVLSTGGGIPAPVGGTALGAPSIQAFNDNGDILFTQSVAGSAVSTATLLRSHPGSPLEVALYTKQAAPGGGTFTSNASGVSVNASGVATFLASAATGPNVYQQAPFGPIVLIAGDGLATGTPLGGQFDVSTTATRTLDNGAAYFQTDLVNATTDHAAFLKQGGAATVLMSTADLLPAGGNTAFRALFIEGAGNHVNFPAQMTGGREAIVTHNISTRTSRFVAADGDPSPTASGGTLRISSFGQIYSNTAGTIVLSAAIRGGTNPGTGVFVSPSSGGLLKIATPGDVDANGRVLTPSAFTSNAGRSPINASGRVVFSASVPLNGVSVFVGSAGGTPVKAALRGDATSAGANINTIVFSSSISPLINDANQVLFAAQLVGGASGLFFAGSPHQKIALTGDAAPGGGTFSAFRQPSINNSGEVVFNALTNGGPGSGIYLYTPSSGLTALALNGGPAPGGGTFSIGTTINFLHPDVIITDQHDIVFFSDLTGGPSNAGYFIRRGANGLIVPLVRQGDPLPGTASVLTGIGHTVNNIPGEVFKIDSAGEFAFLGGVIQNGLRLGGTWHVRTDGSIEEVLLRGQVSPDFGGGLAVAQSQGFSWVAGSRLALRVFIAGGTFGDSIMLFVPSVPNTTPVGTNVSVTPVDSVTGLSPVTVQFSTVTLAGDTTLFTSPGAPTLPGAFALGNPPVFFELSTTAIVTGPIQVCINISGLTFPPAAVIRLLHFENGAWVDATSSGPTNGVICAVVTSLSPFAVVQVLDTTPPSLLVGMSPSVIWPPNGQMVDVTATIHVSDDLDPAPRVELVSITSNEPLAAGDISGAVLGTDDRSFQLRAKRDGKSAAGRIYTITYRATDWVGHATTVATTVTVPHNQ